MNMDATPQDDPPREWKCPACGAKNPLFAVSCRNCHERLTDEEARRQGVKGRERGLPEGVRREFAATKRSFEERVRLHQEHLRKRFTRDMALGASIALVSCILLGCLTQSVLFPLIFLPLGGAAGALLNRRGGGSFTGMAHFGAAFVVGWAASVVLSGVTPLADQIFAVLFFGFGVTGLVLALVGGYLFGMTLSLERFDEGF
ncbi:MAG: hypothetical protein ACYS47_18660 [Planctomycetota bacterium]|jgi:hypothetical protein